MISTELNTTQRSTRSREFDNAVLHINSELAVHSYADRNQSRTSTITQTADESDEQRHMQRYIHVDGPVGGAVSIDRSILWLHAAKNKIKT